MTGSTSSLKNSLLNRAWIQWIALGVDAVGERDDAVVDPEALDAFGGDFADAFDRWLVDLVFDLRGGGRG